MPTLLPGANSKQLWRLSHHHAPPSNLPPTHTYRYLDGFPFPFYILLRDIASLPRTLADLLRQWFELSAGGH